VSLNFTLQRIKHKLRKKLNAGPIVDAHKHCNNNRDELLRSEIAGCFYCCETFAPVEVEDWVDNEKCALCPRCGIDSVIGSASGYPIGDATFLKSMRKLWFDD